MLLFVKGKETNGPERMNQASTEFSTCGSTNKARRINDGREMRRDSSHFKLANAALNDLDKQEIGIT